MKATRYFSYAKMAVVVFLLLCTLVVMAACNNEGNEGGSVSETETENTTADYTVTVQDYKGQTPDSDVLVDLKKGDQVIASKRTDKNGQVVFTQEKGDYTFTLTSTKKVYYYDEAVCAFSAENTAVTVSIYDTYKKTETLYPAFGDDDERTEYKAAVVKEGATHVQIDKAGKGFYVFHPTRGGVYRFSYISDETLTIGYFGEPYAMLAHSGANPEQVAQGYFESEVKNFEPGQLGGSVTICIGLSSEIVTDAILVIERVGDPEKPIPWTYPQANQMPVDFPKTDDETVYISDISVIDPTVKVVKSEADGFYHYGTADGPIVYCRVNSDNRYTPSFAKMCETDRLLMAIKENDTIVGFECYNDLFNSYAEISDKNGLCPLTDELITAIKNVGEYKGWWAFGNNDIFTIDMNGGITGIDKDNIVLENAWLFGCCYVMEH